MNIDHVYAILSHVPAEGAKHSELFDRVASIVHEDTYTVGQTFRPLCIQGVIVCEGQSVTRGPRYDECFAELETIRTAMKAFSAKYVQYGNYTQKG